MHATAGIGIWEMIIVLFMGGAVTGGPLGVPPQKADPYLANTAPRECVWYLSSAGVAEPRSDSPNQTEQLLAEPEVRRFVETLEKEIVAAIRRKAGDRMPESEIVRLAPQIVKALLTRPTAVWLESVALGPDGPAIKAGLVMNVAGQKDQTQEALERLVKITLRGAEIEQVEEAGVTWNKLPIPPGAPRVLWGFHGDHLVIAVGEGVAAQIVGRAQGGSPDWLRQVRKRLPVERVSTVGYLNVKAVMQAAGPLWAIPQARTIAKATGVTGVESIASVSGLDATGCVSKCLVATDGPPSGLLNLVSDRPITKRDLAAIPADTSLAAVVRFDPEEAVETLLGIAESVEPRARQEIERELFDEMREKLGIDLRRDVVNSIGDLWTIHTPEGDSLTSWIGVTATVTVKDHERVRGVHNKLVAAAQAEMQRMERSGRRRRRGASIQDTTYRDQKIYYLNVYGEEFPFAPAWCLTEERLIVGLFPQSVKSYLAGQSDSQSGAASSTRRRRYESLADVPAVRRLLDADTSPTALVYVDSQKIFRSVYPLLQMGAQMACSELQSEGLDVQVDLLPSASAIAPHLRPTTAVVLRTDYGIQFEQRQTLPLLGAAGGVGPMLFGVADTIRHERRYERPSAAPPRVRQAQGARLGGEAPARVREGPPARIRNVAPPRIQKRESPQAEKGASPRIQKVAPLRIREAAIQRNSPNRPHATQTEMSGEIHLSGSITRKEISGEAHLKGWYKRESAPADDRPNPVKVKGRTTGDRVAEPQKKHIAAKVIVNN